MTSIRIDVCDRDYRGMLWPLISVEDCILSHVNCYLSCAIWNRLYVHEGLNPVKNQNKVIYVFTNNFILIFLLFRPCTS